MVKRGSGKIMNVASTASFQPGPMMAVYFATKAYVLSFSEAISNEVGNKGISVTALCPGPTTSGFQTAASMDNSKLFSNKNLPTSSEVAIYGYSAMIKGKTVAIHGIINYILSNSIRFVPRAMVLKISRMVLDRS
jgi:short-subunit dehydrogenase